MRKRGLAFLCACSMMVSLLSMSAAAAAAAAKAPPTYIPTNIPKSFPTVKQNTSLTVVDFWHSMSGTNSVLVTNICNWYNSTEGKKKKIYVKPIYQGSYVDMTIKIQAALQSRSLTNLPDVAQLSVAGAFSVKGSDRVICMEDLMKSDSTFPSVDKMDKNAMYASSYKGKQVGLPFANSMIMLHYNEEAFKSVGLDPENPPRTLDEFAAAATKLLIKGTGKTPIRYGAANKIVLYQLTTWIPRQNKGTAYEFNFEDGRMGTPTEFSCYKDGTLKTTLTAWKKVLDTGAVDFSKQSEYIDFGSGRNAMYTGSMVGYEAVINLRSKYKFTHRMDRLPVVNATDAIGEAVGGSAVYMLDKNNAAKKAASWDFTKFLASVDVSAYWYINSGYYPLNNDALKTKVVQDQFIKFPAKKMIFKVREDSVVNYKFQEPSIPGSSIYSAMVGDQVVLMAKGKQTVDQTVENLAKKATSLLKTYADMNS